MMMTRVLTGCWLLASTVPAPVWGASATASSGCAKTLTSGVYHMTDQSVTRTYRVFVPSGYKPGIPHPLVLAFHGWGGDENEFLSDNSVKNRRRRLVAQAGNPDCCHLQCRAHA